MDIKSVAVAQHTVQKVHKLARKVTVTVQAVVIVIAVVIMHPFRAMVRMAVVPAMVTVVTFMALEIRMAITEVRNMNELLFFSNYYYSFIRFSMIGKKDMEVTVMEPNNH